MAGKAGKKALIKVSGEATAFTDEACTHAGDSKTYQITDTAKRVWDRTATITVKDGGVATAESYTINRLTGTIVFANTGTRTVTVSGSYLPMSTAAECKMYSYALGADILEDTSFGDEWKTHLQGLKTISGTLSRWYVDSYFTDALIAGLPVVIELYSDSSGSFDVRCWALLNQSQTEAAVRGVVEDTVAFAGATDSDLRSISG